jgi:hypothetical protein
LRRTRFFASISGSLGYKMNIASTARTVYLH